MVAPGVVESQSARDRAPKGVSGGIGEGMRPSAPGPVGSMLSWFGTFGRFFNRHR